MALHEEVVDTLRSTLEAACSDPKTGIPGAVAVVVDKNGDHIFSHAAGRRGVASSDKMTTDSVFWIASCTKLVAGIACMQLVEKGVLRLDDGEQMESLCPELKTLKVLRADGALEDKNKAITLRMLLTHTSGFAYSFFNPSLRDHAYPAGVDEFCGRLQDFIQPLVFQPGEGWEYGADYMRQIGIDWAGIALERVTGVRLNDYMRINVFEPLGINDISMFPSLSMMERLAYMNYRSPNGALHPRDHLMRIPLVETDEEQRSRFVHSGGGGLFAKPSEYCKILVALLNNGKSPTTGAAILKPSMVAEMFTNQIPRFPEFSRKGIPAAKPDLTNAVSELYPHPEGAPQGWGLTFMLSNGGATGRSKSTAHWCGLANCFWWCDPENGVAGMITSQILPFGDAGVMGLWAGIEAQVYAGLRAAGSS